MTSLRAIPTHSNLYQATRTHLQVLRIEEGQEDHSEVLEITEEVKIATVLQVDPMKVHSQDPQIAHLRHQILMKVIQTILHHTVPQVHMTIAHLTAHMEDHMIPTIQDHLHQICHQTHHPIHHPIQNLPNKKEVMVDLEKLKALEDKEVRKDSEKIR